MDTNLIVIGADILVSVALLIIAYKSEHPLYWLAIIPLANLWLMCDMADVSPWCLLLFFFPIVNIIIYVWLWMRISENTNKPSWLGILMILPFVNVAVAAYMAFYEPSWPQA